MFNIVNNMINKISLLTPFTSLLVCDTSDVLCLSIKDMITQKEQQQERLALFNKLYEDIKRNSEEVLQNLRQLGLTDVDSYYIAIHIAEYELIKLTRELEKNKEPKKAEELQEKIFFLHYYIYLFYKTEYILRTQYTLKNVNINIRSLLASQAQYIRVIDIFKNYCYKYPKVIKAKTPNFQKKQEIKKEQEKINKMYDAILDTNNKNVEYIEEVCKHNTQKCLSLTIQQIEKLNNDKATKDQLQLICVLIDNYKMRYIQNKIDKLLNILFPLNVITLQINHKIQELPEVLEKLVQKNQQDTIHTNKQYILKYFRYLCAKYEYLDTLFIYISVYISSVVSLNTSLVKFNQEKLEKKLQKYNEVKQEFTKQLSEYLKFIKANKKDKDLQQCKPTQDEIEDVYEQMDNKDKELLMQLQKETKTGIILPEILGIGFTGGIGYVFYRIKTHKKEKDKEQTKEKISITSK